MHRQLPALRKRRASMVKTLATVAAEADQRLSDWSSLEGDARTFATDALAALAQRRDDLKNGLADVNRELAAIESAEISVGAVREALASFGEVYECLQSHERKELVRLVLQRAEVSKHRLVLEIRGGIAGSVPTTPGAKSASRSERPGWLPGLVSQSVIRYSAVMSFRNLRPSRCTPRPDTWRELLEVGAVASRAELARRAGVSRARVTQALGARALS